MIRSNLGLPTGNYQVVYWWVLGREFFRSIARHLIYDDGLSQGSPIGSNNLGGEKRREETGRVHLNIGSVSRY